MIAKRNKNNDILKTIKSELKHAKVHICSTCMGIGYVEKVAWNGQENVVLCVPCPDCGGC